MKTLEQVLAERCLLTKQEPMFIYDVESIHDIFGKQLSLSDLRPGMMVKANMCYESMAQATEQSFWTRSNEPRQETLFIKDVASYDGKLFIETILNGKSFSTINFHDDWQKILEKEALKEFWNKMHNAFEEFGRWNKNDSIEFLENCGINIDKNNPNWRIQVDKIMGEVYKHIKESGLSIETLTKEHIEEIKKAAQKANQDFQQEQAWSRRCAIAKSLLDLNMPIIRLENTDYTRSDRHSDVRQQLYELVSNGRTSGNISGLMVPMMSDSRFADDICLTDLVVHDKIRVNGNWIAITNRGVLTTLDMRQEMSAVIDNNAHPAHTIENIGAYQYLSAMQPDSKMILGGMVPPDYGKPIQHEIMHSDPHGTYDTEIVSPEDISRRREILTQSFEEIANAAVQNGVSITVISGMANEITNNGLEIEKIDHNGIGHQISTCDILPGDRIAISYRPVDKETQEPGERVIETLNISEAYSAGKGTIFVAGDRMFTTEPEMIEAEREITKGLDKTDQEFEQPEIG